MESFEITDYDLENEFNVPGNRRKQTKQQQMLGKRTLTILPLLFI